MVITVPLNTASSLLLWSNRIYVTGAVLTLTSAAMVLYEKHSKNLGRSIRWGLTTEIVVIIAAFICLCGTIGAITFGNIVSHLKDVDLATYKATADTKIAQANKDADKALSDAATANKKAEDTKQANLQLQIELSKHEWKEKQAEAKLAAQNQQTAQFAQGVAQQQQGMAQQMQAAPSLSDAQVDVIAKLLTPFAGRTVSVHTMMDARSQRLAGRFQQAFSKAGIKFDGSSTDMGPNYVGIMILVKNPTPNPHPPIADVLHYAIQSVGIQPHGAADASLKEDEVRLCIGPE